MNEDEVPECIRVLAIIEDAKPGKELVPGHIIEKSLLPGCHQGRHVQKSACVKQK